MPQKHNAFFFYMRTMKQEKAAWRYKDYRELSQLCSDGWNKLSKEEKEIYEEMRNESDIFVDPKKKKNKTKGAVDERGLDCLGRPIMFLRSAEVSEREMERAQIREIKDIVECARNILTEEFLVIHVTNYCITKRDPIVYCPAEISIGKFNVRKGYLQDVFHHFIIPEVPLGYKLMIQENCEKVLKIPFDFNAATPIDHVSKSLMIIEDDIMRSRQAASNSTIPIFCLDAEMDVCNRNLEKIYEGEAEGTALKVYPLAELVVAIIGAGTASGAGITASTIGSMIHHQKREFEGGFGCDWHEENGEMGLCSTGVIKKWCKSIMEILHPLLNL